MNEQDVLRWETIACIAGVALAGAYILLFYGLKLKEMSTSKKIHRRHPTSSVELEAGTEKVGCSEVQPAVPRCRSASVRSTGDESKTKRRDHVDRRNSRNMDESSGRRTETSRNYRRRNKVATTVPVDTACTGTHNTRASSSDGRNADNLPHQHCTRPVKTASVGGESFGPVSRRNRTKPVRTVAIASGHNDTSSDKDTTVGSNSPEQSRMKDLTASRGECEKSLEGHSSLEDKGKGGDFMRSSYFKEEETGYDKVNGEGHKKARKRHRRKRGSKEKAAGAIEGLSSPETADFGHRTHASSESTSNSEQSKSLQPAVEKTTENLVPHRERRGKARTVDHHPVQDRCSTNAAKARTVDNESSGRVISQRRTNTARRGSVDKAADEFERDEPRTKTARTKPFNSGSHQLQAGHRRSNPDRSWSTERVNPGPRQDMNNIARAKSSCSVNYGPPSDHPAGYVSTESGSDGSEPGQHRSGLDSSLAAQCGPSLGRTTSVDSGYHDFVSENDERSSPEPSAMLDSDVPNDNQEQAGISHDSKNSQLDRSNTTATENSANASTKIIDTSILSLGKEKVKEFDTESEKKESKMLKKPFKRRADLRLPSWPPQDNYLFIVDRPPVPGCKNISLVHGDWGEDLDPRFSGPRKGPWAYDYDDDEELFGPSVVTDNICEMFMKWGICHAGDKCTQRHPSCRYPCTPKPKPGQAEPHGNQSNQKSTKPVALDSTREQRHTETYATVIARLDRLKVSRDDPSLAALRGINSEDKNRRNKYEEAWPSLGSTRDGKNSETKQPINNAYASTSSFWSATKSIMQPADSPSDPYQVANDRLVAEAVQEQEYAGGCGYEQDDTNSLIYGDEYDEDEYSGSYEENPFPEEGVYVSSHNNTSGSNYSASQLESSTASYQEKLNAFGSSGRSDVTATQKECEVQSRTVPLGQSTEPVDPKDLCEICMDGPKDATLLCGHRFCFLCAHQMRVDEKQCAICRRPILTVIKTYN